MGILFIGFDLSAFQTALQQMASDSKLLNSGGPVIIDPKKSPAEAIYIAHPSAKGKKAIEAVPGAEATPAALAAAGDGPVPARTPPPARRASSARRECAAARARRIGA